MCLSAGRPAPAEGGGGTTPRAGRSMCEKLRDRSITLLRARKTHPPIRGCVEDKIHDCGHRRGPPRGRCSLRWWRRSTGKGAQAADHACDQYDDRCDDQYEDYSEGRLEDLHQHRRCVRAPRRADYYFRQYCGAADRCVTLGAGLHPVPAGRRSRQDRGGDAQGLRADDQRQRLRDPWHDGELVRGRHNLRERPAARSLDRPERSADCGFVGDGRRLEPRVVGDEFGQRRSDWVRLDLTGSRQPRAAPASPATDHHQHALTGQPVPVANARRSRRPSRPAAPGLR